MTEPRVRMADCGHWIVMGTGHEFTIGASTRGHMEGGRALLCSRCAVAVRAARPRRQTVNQAEGGQNG